MDMIYYHHPTNTHTICHSFTLWLPGSFANAYEYLLNSEWLKDKLIILPGYRDKVMQCCVSGKVRKNIKNDLFPKETACLEFAEEIGFNIDSKYLQKQLVLTNSSYIHYNNEKVHKKVYYYSYLLKKEQLVNNNILVQFRDKTKDTYENRVCFFVGIDKDDIDIVKKRNRLQTSDEAGETIILMPYQMLLAILYKYKNKKCEMINVQLPPHQYQIIK